MTRLKEFSNFTNVEDGKKQLLHALAIRDQHAGWLNRYAEMAADCKEIAEKLKGLGADAAEIDGMVSGSYMVV